MAMVFFVDKKFTTNSLKLKLCITDVFSSPGPCEDYILRGLKFLRREKPSSLGSHLLHFKNIPVSLHPPQDIKKPKHKRKL